MFRLFLFAYFLAKCSYEFCLKFYISLKMIDVAINRAYIKIEIFYYHCYF